MRRVNMHARAAALFFLAALSAALHAQDMPKEYQDVIDALGRKGDFRENVLKIGIPRNDLAVSVAGVALPTPFGFGGWIAMTPGDRGQSVMMGDLVLLQEEVNPVMSALLGNGLEVTALHNHFFWDEPRVFYMHVHGHGAPATLARELRPALDIVGAAIPADVRERNIAANAAQVAGALDTAALARVIGRALEKAGAAYKVTIGRDDIVLREMGARINARMGLNTWAAFAGSDEHAAIAGDVAMLEGEMTPVLTALRAHGLSVVAIHHHMVGSRPVVLFLHYWGTGRAADLAAAFRAALDETAKPPRGDHGMWNRR